MAYSKVSVASMGSTRSMSSMRTARLRRAHWLVKAFIMASLEKEPSGMHDCTEAVVSVLVVVVVLVVVLALKKAVLKNRKGSAPKMRAAGPVAS